MCNSDIITAFAKLVIVNDPTNIIVCTGAIGIMPCGFVNDSINIQPHWNIITKSDDGNVISNVTVTPNEINSDNNNSNSDRLVYEPDLTSGSNNATNNRLLVGPVDETHNQSSYQCIFDLAGGDVISSIGTVTVAGEYHMIAVYIYMFEQLFVLMYCMTENIGRRKK